MQRRFPASQEPGSEQHAVGAEHYCRRQPQARIPPPARTGTGVTAATTRGTSVMVVCQPTCPPPSVPCAMITSAPACAARTASGTPPAMNVTLQPAAWARSTYGFTSCSGRGQAKAITEGRSVSADAKESSSIANSRKFRANGPICQFANGGRPGMNLLGRQVMAAHGAQTARTGHGCHELRRVHRAHAAERDGMIDLQEVAYRRSDHGFALRLIADANARSCPRERCRRGGRG